MVEEWLWICPVECQVTEVHAVLQVGHCYFSLLTVHRGWNGGIRNDTADVDIYLVIFVNRKIVDQLTFKSRFSQGHFLSFSAVSSLCSYIVR